MWEHFFSVGRKIAFINLRPDSWYETWPLNHHQISVEFDITAPVCVCAHFKICVG